MNKTAEPCDSKFRILFQNFVHLRSISLYKCIRHRLKQPFLYRHNLYCAILIFYLNFKINTGHFCIHSKNVLCLCLLPQSNRKRSVFHQLAVACAFWLFGAKSLRLVDLIVGI